MWWNILPSWFVTAGLVYVPVLVCPLSAYLFFGSAHNRSRDHPYFHYLILRDQRVLDGEDPFLRHKHRGGLDKIQVD